MADPIYYSCIRCRHSHNRVGSLPTTCPSCVERQALEALSRPLRLQAMRRVVDGGRARAHAEMVHGGGA